MQQCCGECDAAKLQYRIDVSVTPTSSFSYPSAWEMKRRQILTLRTGAQTTSLALHEVRGGFHQDKPAAYSTTTATSRIIAAIAECTAEFDPESSVAPLLDAFAALAPAHDASSKVYTSTMLTPETEQSLNSERWVAMKSMHARDALVQSARYSTVKASVYLHSSFSVRVAWNWSRPSLTWSTSDGSEQSVSEPTPPLPIEASLVEMDPSHAGMEVKPSATS